MAKRKAASKKKTPKTKKAKPASGKTRTVRKKTMKKIKQKITKKAPPKKRNVSVKKIRRAHMRKIVPRHVSPPRAIQRPKSAASPTVPQQPSPPMPASVPAKPLPAPAQKAMPEPPKPQMSSEKALFWAQLAATHKKEGKAEPPAEAAAPMPQAAAPKPAEQTAKSVVPEAQTLQPALELLPPWEDREMLRRLVEEKNLSFSSPAPGSADFDAALKFAGSVRRQAPGQFICCRDGNGNLLGAMEFQAPQETLLILHSRASEAEKKLHALLYAAALARAKPKYAVCTLPRGAISEEMAGRLIVLGRGLGMCAMPVAHPSLLFFLRRIGMESDFATTGPELSGVLRSVKSVFDGALNNSIAEMMLKGAVMLVPLPNSPDRREHLHELKELVLALGIPADNFEAVADKLRFSYVYERRDITPAILL